MVSGRSRRGLMLAWAGLAACCDLGAFSNCASLKCSVLMKAGHSKKENTLSLLFFSVFEIV